MTAYPGSIIAIDFRENIENGWFAQKYINQNAIYKLDITEYPYEADTDRENALYYNPLKTVVLGSVQETSSIRDIAFGLCIESDKPNCVTSTQWSYWNKKAITLLTGAITHECYCAILECREPSMAYVRSAVTCGDAQISLINWRDTKHLHGMTTHPVVEAVALEMLQATNNELSSIFSTASLNLSLWLDPIIKTISTPESTPEKSRQIFDIISNLSDVSVLITLPYGVYNNYMPLIRIFFLQLISVLKKPFCKANKTLIICEENIFSQLEHLARGMRFVRTAPGAISAQIPQQNYYFYECKP